MLLTGVLCGWEDRRTDTPHRSSHCSGGHHPLSHGFWGGGCSCQMCTPTSGWEFGMGVVWGCSQDASHRGNSHVERDQTGQHWELGPCLHSLAAALPLSGNSFKNIYIYKIESCFIYICISISVLSPWIPLSIHPSIPTEARCPCPAPLVSSRGEAFLSVPSP